MVKEDKGFFDKKIVYLDYFERGTKVKNGGFIKWEARGDTSRVQVHIRGLYPTDTLQGEIQILSYGEPYTADRVMLNFGTGEYAAIWKNGDLAGTGISYEDCDGIVVKISENRLLKGQWRERRRETARTEPEPEMLEQPMPQPEVLVIPEPELSEQPELSELQPVAPATELLGECIREPITPPAEDTYTMEASVESAEPVESVKPEKKEPERKREERRKPEPVLLSGDKWEQLNKQYPRIHPFGDAREYLSITPRDFVILSRQYQNLVQNSFLLHGYYNYGHVILTRLKEREEEHFYLGVPGVYFDREKQAALMFGFEGFEAGGDQIAEGGFGYYMKRVEI